MALLRRCGQVRSADGALGNCAGAEVRLGKLNRRTTRDQRHSGDLSWISVGDKAGPISPATPLGAGQISRDKGISTAMLVQGRVPSAGASLIKRHGHAGW